jgi:hypothetical protein
LAVSREGRQRHREDGHVERARQPFREPEAIDHTGGLPQPVPAPPRLLLETEGHVEATRPRVEIDCDDPAVRGGGADGDGGGEAGRPDPAGGWHDGDDLSHGPTVPDACHPRIPHRRPGGQRGSRGEDVDNLASLAGVPTPPVPEKAVTPVEGDQPGPPLHASGAGGEAPAAWRSTLRER